MKGTKDNRNSFLYYDYHYDNLVIRVIADDAILSDASIDYVENKISDSFAIHAGENDVIVKAVRFLDAFFHGKRAAPPPLDLSGFTENEKCVYMELQKVPFGETVSYGDLALRAGFPNAARFVGSTMRKNRFSIFIPCHRVISASGRVGNYSPDPRIKDQLIRFEKSLRK